MRANRAFTLIEILLVLTIIGILTIVLLPKFVEFLQRGKVQETRAIAQQIVALADSYANETGDFPSSSYEGLAANPGNDLNVGIESFVALVAAPNSPVSVPEESSLINSDEDRFPKKVTVWASDDAFELRDAWGNPFAYFHHRDYPGKRHAYRCTGDAGVGGDSDVEARKSEKTGNWLRPVSYQLISAGKDGEFGTDDDVVYGEGS